MRNEKLAMSRVQITKNEYKEQRKKITALLCSLLFAFCSLITACENIVVPPEIQKPVKNGYGKISISFVEEETARTVLPSTVFTRYVYTFTKKGGTTGVVKNPDSNGFFTLEVGSYTVAVQAYIGAAEPYTLAASGASEEFSVGPGINDPVKVPLAAVAAAGQGKFSYTITWPAGAAAEITLQQWPGLNTIALNPVNVTQGNGKTQTLGLGAGSYLLTILVVNNGLYAGISEAVRIYPVVTTVYDKNFAVDDFYALIPPAVNDYTISETKSFIYDGAAKTVTITPQTGKSTGIITVYYEGTGSTAYAKSTTAPSAIGAYTVTFDVAAAGDFNAASELPAGTLTIFDSVFTSIADLNTYLQGKPANTAATAYTVVLNVNNLDDAYNTAGSAGYVLRDNNTKYVFLDLSGSTFTSISDTFRGCVSLTGITIPNSVTRIWGDYAFQNCTSLTSITIPNSVTSIGGFAFYGCTSLASITIPNSVTSIESGAFYGCTSLASVTIPNSVTTIEPNVFYGCTSLTSITLPTNTNFTRIGYQAFSRCTSLESITIPNSVTSIDGGAFAGCWGLTSITLPTNPNFTSIGESAFSSCISLESITIPNSVTSIGSYAFSSCTSLESITIPNSVTSIGGDAFSSCTSLTAINVDTSNTAYISDDGVLYNKAKTALIRYPAGKTDNTFTIPASVTRIGSYAFASCTSFTSVTIPNNVTSIESYAFDSCTSLTSVTFEGTIIEANFGPAYLSLFPGDLRNKYLAAEGGIGTYTRPSGGMVWTKQ